jgi:hypothetical protein
MEHRKETAIMKTFADLAPRQRSKILVTYERLRRDQDVMDRHWPHSRLYAAIVLRQFICGIPRSQWHPSWLDSHRTYRPKERTRQ